jgi:hypothetical protein
VGVDFAEVLSDIDTILQVCVGGGGGGGGAPVRDAAPAQDGAHPLCGEMQRLYCKQMSEARVRPRPGGRLPLSTAIHLNVPNTSCYRMYI